METRAHIIITICIILMIVGCSENNKVKKQIPELVLAEEVMFARPDSALHILQTMPMPSPKKDKENHALWCLLTTQAQYKENMKIPSDSLISIAYHYYKPTDNAQRKAMSALYMGGVDYDLGKIEEAIHFYLEAKTEMEKTDDYQLGYLVMSGLGNVYLYRRLTDYALEACTQAYDYAVKDNNKRYQMTALHYLARCYCVSENLEKAIELYQQCAKMSLELGLENNSFYSTIMRETALVYTHMEQYDKSLAMIRSFPSSPLKSLLMGQNYLLLEKLDSAYYYLEDALQTDNIYSRRTIYRHLYQLSDIPKYQHHMKEYCDSLLFYNDSIMALDKGKEIIAYKEKYDHQKLINEQQRLKLEKAETQRVLFIIILFLLVIIAVVAYLYQKRLVRKEMAIRKQSEQLQEYMLQLHEYETRFMQNSRYLEELKSQLSGQEDNAEELQAYREQIDRLQAENGRFSEKIETLQQHIAAYTSSLANARKEAAGFRELSEENLKLKQREQMLADYVAANHPMLKSLKENSRPLDDGEWESLKEMCENTYGRFVTHLSEACPSLTKQELYLCLLIKLRFGNTQMAEIFGVSASSVSQKKFRLKKHLSESLKEGLSEDVSLDRWLTEF